MGPLRPTSLESDGPLSDNWSSFLSGRLRQVLLYNQLSIYIIEPQHEISNNVAF